MLRVTLKGVRGHVVRFLLTALAVTLGVAFVAGSFVLRDSMSNTLDDLLTAGTKGVDVVARGTHIRPGDDTPRAPLDASLAQKISAVDGVASARPNIQGEALLIGKDGHVVRNGGAPTFGFPYRTGDPSFRLVSGTGPTGPGEIAVEKSTLDKAGLSLGDTAKVIVGDEARTVRITGVVEFGSLLGATAILLDEDSARAAFARDGKVSGIDITAASGVSQDELRSRVAAVLPKNAEAVTATTVVDEQKKIFQQITDVFGTFLLVFAMISLFVGAFIIVNTFSIVLAQRTRELALLRAVGASRGQIRRMVLGEALIVGFVGSALGILVGAGLASGLKSVIKGFIGLDIAGGLPIGAQTIIWSLASGVLVTAVAALLPARRAAKIPPVAAMRDDMVATPSSVRRRGAVGVVVFALGAALLTSQALAKDVNWGGFGVGAALVLIGALIAAPLVTRPVVRVLSWPFVKFGGVVGRLAGQNAIRVPRRTANTASALMVGLTLVAGLAVLASSTKTSFGGLISDQLRADYVLSAGQGAAVPAGVAKSVAGLPGVASVAPVGQVRVAVGKDESDAVTSTGRALADNVKLDVQSGDLAAIDKGQILVDEPTAKKHNWKVGSTVTADVGTLTDQKLTVGGVYAQSDLLGSPYIVGEDLYRHSVRASEQVDFLVLVKAAEGADLTALQASIADVTKQYVMVTVENRQQYIDSTASNVDQLLALLYVLLALAIVIAVLGIINTLALSVVERTREIGLLRAVGLRRRQLSRMITVESVTTAVFGAVLGTVLGLGLGTALQHAWRSNIPSLTIPWATIIVVLVSAGVVGVIAAVLPAVRAVRLNILRAIATD